MLVKNILSHYKFNNVAIQTFIKNFSLGELIFNKPPYNPHGSRRNKILLLSEIKAYIILPTKHAPAVQKLQRCQFGSCSYWLERGD